MALHVASHKGTVGVVVFQKGDQACCDAHELHRRDVHEFDLIARHKDELSASAGAHQVALEAASLVDLGVRLSDYVVILF